MIRTEEAKFKIDREDYNYKGVLIAQTDGSQCLEEMKGCFPAIPEDYFGIVIAIIWTDETGMWHAKMKVEFPSGNKQIVLFKFDEEFNTDIKVNETYILNHIYKIPMKRKKWKRNPEGTATEFKKIIKDLGLSKYFDK